MEVVKDNRIDSKYGQYYHKYSRSLTSIKRIVIHGTGLGNGYWSADRTLQWMFKKGNQTLYRNATGLFHYFNDRNGKVIEVVDPQYCVWHSSSGRREWLTVGIENINRYDNALPYTDAQYESLFQLIFEHIAEGYTEKNITDIVGHGRQIYLYSNPNAPKIRKCPGTGFDWSKLEAELDRRKYTWHKVAWMHYHIDEYPKEEKEIPENTNLKEIAIEGFTFKKEPDGGWTPGTETLTTYVTTNKIKATGKVIYTKWMQWEMSGCTYPNHTFDNGATFNFLMPTSSGKVKFEGELALRKGDTQKCQGQFTHIPSGNPVMCQCQFTIDDCGQTKLKSD